MARSFLHAGTVWATDRLVLTGLRDLVVVDTGADLVVQAVAGPAPGFQLSAWSLADLGLLDSAAISGPGSAGIEPDLIAMTGPAGQGGTLLLGDGQAGLAGVHGDGAGGFGETLNPGGSAVGLSRGLIDLAVTWQGDDLFAFGLMSGARTPTVWSVEEDGRFTQVSDGANAPAQNGVPAPGLTGIASAGGYVAAGGTGAVLVALYDIRQDGRLSLSDKVEADDNPGMGGDVVMAMAEAGGQTHVIAGAAGSGTLTVWSVTPDGALELTDHIIDTTESRFQGVSHLEVVTHEGAIYVAAGGADSGASLFRLTSEGRLVQVAVLADGLDWSLDGLAALDLEVDAQGQLHLVTAGQRDAGLSHFTYDPGPGRLVEGGTGDDDLSGGRKDDILHDGAGSDTLSGGVGADMFLFTSDGMADTIIDFNPAQDQLDLSGWAFWRSPHQLTINTRLDGAEIVFDSPAGLESLTLLSANGQPLAAAQILGVILPGPDRFLPSWLNAEALRPPGPDPDVARQLSGTPGDDVLQGEGAGDTITGLGGSDQLGGGAGADVIVGGLGFDTVLGGDGDDLIRGMDGFDSLMGGSGNDWLDGNNGNDWLDGNAGSDTITGGIGADTAYGGSGDDTILGGSGPDAVWGGGDADLLQGNAGGDTLSGDAGADRLEGGIGNDVLNGGTGDDMLLGANGADSLQGDAGNDVLRGNAGNDSLNGGDDDDVLSGGIGSDRLWGGAGDDYLLGENGFDILHGGAGNDTLEGNAGNDRLEGGGGTDLLDGGLGADTFVFRGGQVTVTRFQAGIDTVLLDAALLDGNSPDPVQILAGAEQIGDDWLFDFGADGALRLELEEGTVLDPDDFGLL